MSTLRSVVAEASPVLAFATGFAAGRAGLDVPGWLVDLLLVLLVGLAGFEIGYSAPGRLRGLAAGLGVGAVFAAVVLASEALVGLILSPLSRLPARVSVAVAMASGWYTLAGPLLAQYSAYAGMVGLVSNMLREMLHLVLYPALARRGLSLEAVAAAGATAMDTGLPVVAAYGGPAAASTAAVQGMLLTLALPVILPRLL